MYSYMDKLYIYIFDNIINKYSMYIFAGYSNEEMTTVSS